MMQIEAQHWNQLDGVGRRVYPRRLYRSEHDLKNRVLELDTRL